MITFYTKKGKSTCTYIGYVPFKKLHRLDGPAIVWYDGDKDWYINGKKLNTKKVEAWIKNNNINLKTKAHQALFMLRFG